MAKRKFIINRYTKTRQGRNKILQITCSKCNTEICKYQKDGDGRLLRLYLDRILSPDTLTQVLTLDKKDIASLICPNCHTVLAVPYIYKKENRLAYRIINSSIHKKEV